MLPSGHEVDIDVLDDGVETFNAWRVLGYAQSLRGTEAPSERELEDACAELERERRSGRSATDGSRPGDRSAKSDQPPVSPTTGRPALSVRRPRASGDRLPQG
ncbi:hypothetical protein [Actinomadura terrae]|uniref:hypothetical protein n=1 Tax=Actinomadura terrae TaxID=604353 RepID=UPI0035578815